MHIGPTAIRQDQANLFAHPRTHRKPLQSDKPMSNRFSFGSGRFFILLCPSLVHANRTQTTNNTQRTASHFTVKTSTLQLIFLQKISTGEKCVAVFSEQQKQTRFSCLSSPIIAYRPIGAPRGIRQTR
jgi:hypothetical protein